MVKFKVGDKVVLKPDAKVGKSYDNLTLLKEIYKDFKSHPFLIVDDISNDAGSLFLNKWWVSPKVVDLYKPKESLFKIGDIVYIKSIEGKPEDYPCKFIKAKQQFSSRVAIVTCVKQSNFYNEYKFYNNDDYVYTLDLMDEKSNISKYYWHSSMLEKIATTAIDLSIKECIDKSQQIINQNTKQNEIRFQKPKTSIKRGIVPEGRKISGRKDKIAVCLGSLSYQVCNI